MAGLGIHVARRTRRASKDQFVFDFDTLWADPEADRLEEETDEQVREPAAAAVDGRGPDVRQQPERSDDVLRPEGGRGAGAAPEPRGDRPAGETYLQKVGPLNAARQRAEEIVLAEYQPPSVTPEPDEPEDWDEMSHEE